MIKLELARELFNVAHKDKDRCLELIEKTNQIEDPFLKCYHGAALMVSSKYILNPFISVKKFNEGKSIVEEVLSNNPNQVELHYIRYTLQMNSPKFLGYYRNKSDDRNVFMNYLHLNKNDELCRHMLVYLLDTNDLTAEEKTAILP